MSEEHNVDETGNIERTASVNRRRFVKGLGVTGVVSIGMSGAVGASVNDEDDTVHIGDGIIQKMTGPESNKAAVNARRAESFRLLRQHLRQEYNYLVDASGESVGKVENPNGEVFHLVSFDVLDRGSKSTVPASQASTVVVLQNGQVIKTKGIVITETDSSPTQKSQITQTKKLIEVNVINGEIHSESTQLSDEGSSDKDNEVTIQSTPASCSQCVAIAKAAYAIGCGYGVAFICSAIGLASIGVGGVVCAAVAYAVCGTGVAGRDARASCQIIGDCPR